MTGDDETVGYKCPPIRSRFKPGQSGNRRGRPRKSLRVLLPGQVRKDVLKVADEVIEVSTADGKRKMTKGELIMQVIANGALKGKATCLRLWVQLYQQSLQERYDNDSTARLVAMLDDIVMDHYFDGDTKIVEARDFHFKITKGRY